MDIYRILEKFDAVGQDNKQLNENAVGSAAGSMAPATPARPSTDKEQQWDAQALAQHKARLAREKNAMGMQLKMQNPKPMEETMMDESDQGLDHICRTHKAACDHFRDGGDLDSELFDALYNHFLSRGEMPYGVAKARDGDPINWCSEKLAQHLGLEECGTGWPLGAGEVAPMAESTERISFLAGLTEGRMCPVCKCKPCECDESEMEEGNDFTKARLDAIKAGKPTFKVGGKTYKVKGDTSDEKKQVEEAAKPDFLDLDKDGDKKEPMKKAAKEKKVEESKPAFPGSPEYEKKYGKPTSDDDSAFEKTKTSTGTVYKRKMKDEPESDDDDTPKKKGRPTGTGRKLGAKGPSAHSKLIKHGPAKAKKKVKEDEMDIVDRGEYDQEGDMAKDQIHTIVRHARELEKILRDNENLPEWVQEKLAQVKGMMVAVSDYMVTQAERGAEEATGEEGITMDEAGYSAKAGRAGKDLGKPGKNFAKIAKSAGERYGSKAAGERVAGAVLKKLRHADESELEEDWGTKMHTPDSKKGMFKGKTKAELQSQLSKLKASGPHEKGSAAYTKMKELQFAIRAKSGWGKVDEEEIEERSVSQAQARMMAGAAHDPKFAKKVGVKQSVAKEFNKADKGHKMSELPKKKAKEESVEETTVAGSVATSSAPAKDPNAPKKSSAKGGMKIGTGVYEGQLAEDFDKALNSLLSESISVNTSQDDHGTKSVTVTASDDDADKLSELLQMAGLFSSGGYKSHCPKCGSSDCGCDEQVEEAYGDVAVDSNRELANSPEEEYADTDTMVNTLSGGLNGRKRDQTTNPVVKLDRIAGQIEEDAKNRLWKLYGEIAK